MRSLRGGLAWQLVFVTVFCVFCLSAIARGNASVGCPKTQLMPDGSTQYVDCQGKVTDTIPPPVLPPAGQGREGETNGDSSPLVRAAHQVASQKYYESEAAEFQYEADSYSHTRQVFHWQHVSSIIIFWVVILLVLSGLVLAILQVRAANMAAGRKTKGSTEGTAVPDEATTIKGSLSGEIEIKSSVIGLLILVVSLGFFSLYLRYVYPVQVVGGPQVQDSAK